MAKKTYNVGRVSVEMVADTVQYVQKLKEAEDKTKSAHKGIRKEYSKTGRQSSTTGKNVDGLNDRLQEAAKTAQLVQGPLGGVAARLTTLSSVASSSLSPVSKLAIGISAVATAAVAGSVAAFKLASAQAEVLKEVQAYAKIAGTTTQQMWEYGKATESVGITTSKFADITKDVNEKLGEFIDTGGGGFKDFFEQVAPQVGLTADELQRMSGPEALQAVKDAMDAANVPMKQQVFYLESIASDSSLLIPLLAQQGKELTTLTEKYGDMNQVMSEGTLTALNNLNSSIGTAGQSFVNFIAEAISPFLDGMDAMTVAAGEFFATWTKELQASNIAENPMHNFTEGIMDNEVALKSWLATSENAISIVDGDLKELDENNRKRGRNILRQQKAELKAAKEQIQENQRIAKERIKQLEEQRKAENTFMSRDNKKFGAVAGGKVGAETTGVTEAQKQADARYRIEDQLYRDILQLEQQFQNEWAQLQEKYGINNDERALAETQANLDVLQQAYDQGLVSHEQFEMAKTKITEENAKKRQQAERATNLMAIQSFQSATSSILTSLTEMGQEGSAAYKALFLVNQAAGIANAIVSAEVGAAKALELGPIGVPLSATIRAAGYMSAGVIAGQTIAGVAHGGMDSVPSESTFLLQQGERVIQPEANKDLTKFLNTAESGGSMGGTTVNYNPTINGAFDSTIFSQELAKHSKQLTAQINKVEKQRPTRRRQ